MSDALWVTGDTLATLRAMPDASVDLVMTSPPFLALRSYLPADDPAKAQEIGQEPTPGAFLDTLLDITEECARVLAPHGSLCVELGDTYSGSGGAGGDYNADGLRDGQPKFEGSNTRRGKVMDHDSGRRTPAEGWPLAKSLCLIPELYRFALAYGFNPLTQRRTDPWRVRNVVRWCRPNPPVGALGDKFRPGTSDLVVACKSGKRWFDLDAVREPSQDTRPRNTNGPKSNDASEEVQSKWETRTTNPAGAPPLDWWEIPTAPYKGSHYATFPPALVVRPVKAMCPLEVCRTCGEPRRRIVKETEEYANRPNSGRDFLGDDHDRGQGKSAPAPFRAGDDPSRQGRQVETIGWTDCGHDDFRTGRVLDIFGGSGTTLQVATGHGRDAIGIDLDARNAVLARDRIGPMFFKQMDVAELSDWLT